MRCDKLYKVITPEHKTDEQWAYYEKYVLSRAGDMWCVRKWNGKNSEYVFPTLEAAQLAAEMLYG